MNRDEMRTRNLAKLDEAQRRTHERLGRMREQIDERFERKRERLKKKYGEPDVNQQRIVSAALELLDEDGLNNLSLRKLAARLNMQAPALYWHFKSKEMLIDYMAEAMLQAEFKDLLPRKSDEAWQDWLIQVCRQLRSAMRSHRDGARVIAGAHLYPAVTIMKIFEAGMESLVSAGIEERRARLLIITAAHFVFGNVIEEQSAPTPQEVLDFINSDLLKDYPWMSKGIDQTIKDMQDGRDEFEDALRLIVGSSKNKNATI